MNIQGLGTLCIHYALPLVSGNFDGNLLLQLSCNQFDRGTSLAWMHVVFLKLACYMVTNALALTGNVSVTISGYFLEVYWRVRCDTKYR